MSNSVKFSQLVSGDRFIYPMNEEIYTKIDNETARHHRVENFDIFGCIGDTHCSFEPDDLVEFKPV